MDDNFVLSPAALWSCLIVFLLDPPPENFEQLTLGKTFIAGHRCWLKVHNLLVEITKKNGNFGSLLVHERCPFIHFLGRFKVNLGQL